MAKIDESGDSEGQAYTNMNTRGEKVRMKGTHLIRTHGYHPLNTTNVLFVMSK